MTWKEGPVVRMSVDYANDHRVVMGAPNLQVADQLRAEGFQYVEVVTEREGMTVGQWDLLDRTFRWKMGMPLSSA